MKKKRTRLIVNKGTEKVVLKVEDVAYVYRDDMVIVAVDKNDKKYFCDGSLSNLEEELDPVIFFRANRRHLVNVHYIKSFKTVEKVKLALSLSFPNPHRDIIVSQEIAPVFRKWIKEEI